MTDEEMAEKYAIENWEYYEEGQTDSKALKQAFLEGLRAGRSEQHDLRKNPKDLPDNNRCVWTNVGAGYYDGDGDGWWDDFGRLQGVTAWCEPKFEE